MKMKFFTTVSLLVVSLLSCEKSDYSELLKFYGDAYEDIGYSIARSDNGYLIAGQFTRITRVDNSIKSSVKKLVLIETGFNGNEIRKDTTNSNLASCGIKVITLGDGSAVIAGNIIESSRQHICLVKFAPGGEGYIDKILDFPGNVHADDIIKTPGGYLVLATTDAERGSSDDTGNPQGKKDILLLSLNENLEVLSSITYGFTGNDEAIAIKADRFGGYIVVGTTDRYMARTGTDILIISVNEDISNVSAKSGRVIELDNDQSASDLEVTDDGYFIAGNTSMGGMSKGFACKITGTIWGTEEHRIIEFPGLEDEPFTVNAICSYKTNSFLMAGQSGPATSGSMLIFATDMLGNPVDGRRRIAGGTGNQVAYDVITDGEDIVAIGKNSYENNSMITLLKFRF